MSKGAFNKILILLLIKLNVSWATTLVLPVQNDLIGGIQFARSEVGETLRDVGFRFDMGYQEMVKANPSINPSSVLAPGTKLLIPSQFILPAKPRQGIVINLAEYRLYYFPPNDNTVITMPIGIGRKGWETPIGTTTIISKEQNPSWHPTSKLRLESAKKGLILPDVVPAGRGNPLGNYVLRLNWPAYLIHGSNYRGGVGERISAGCIRMLPEDIEQLFELVKIGTTVNIIHEPTNFSLRNGQIKQANA